ncbi:MAG TPA: ROK family protein [bacterium]|nr:ROK family protein [bacterium]
MTLRHVRGARARNTEVVLALDVGGSSVKSALVSRAGFVRRGSFRRTPVDPRGTREEIIDGLTGVIACGLRTAEDSGWPCRGIVIAMPGPCDYRTGITLMRHKFGAIFGVSLAVEIRGRLGLDGATPIAFVHDTGAFLLGEAWRGAARGYSRVMAITLGTGIGSAFMADGRLAVTHTGMPVCSVWDQPYDGGIVEDAVSGAAIVARYRKLSGTTMAVNVEQIASRAMNGGDLDAEQTFAGLGATVAAAIRPTVLRFEPEILVFGGRISKAFRLFEVPLRARLKTIRGLKQVVPGRSIDFSALYGAAKIVWGP